MRKQDFENLVESIWQAGRIRRAGRSRSRRSIFQEAHEQLEDGGGTPHEQFWQEVAQNRLAKARGRVKDIGRKAR